MANVGLSRPYYSKYQHDGNGNVSYSGGGRFNKAVGVEIGLDNADPVKKYADNSVVESTSVFSSGKMTLTVDEMRFDEAAAVLGITVADTEEPEGKVITFASEDAAPYCGFGIIAKKIIGGVTKWMAIILHKVQFSPPTDSLTTQEETIEFGDSQIEAIIVRDDTEKGKWRTWAMFDTEGNAAKYIKKILNITEEGD